MTLLRCAVLLAMFAVVLTACLSRCLKLRDRLDAKWALAAYTFFILCAWTVTVFFGVAPLFAR